MDVHPIGVPGRGGGDGGDGSRGLVSDTDKSLSVVGLRHWAALGRDDDGSDGSDGCCCSRRRETPDDADHCEHERGPAGRPSLLPVFVQVAALRGASSPHHGGSFPRHRRRPSPRPPRPPDPSPRTLSPPTTSPAHPSRHRPRHHPPQRPNRPSACCPGQHRAAAVSISVIPACRLIASLLVHKHSPRPLAIPGRAPASPQSSPAVVLSSSTPSQQ